MIKFKASDKPFQFYPCVFCRKLPVDFCLSGIAFLIPCFYFSSHYIYCGNSFRKALALEDTQFYFGNIQPASMFRSMMNFKAFRQAQNFLGMKRFVKRRYVVRVQIVHDKDHLFYSRIT